MSIWEKGNYQNDAGEIQLEGLVPEIYQTEPDEPTLVHKELSSIYKHVVEDKHTPEVALNKQSHASRLEEKHFWHPFAIGVSCGLQLHKEECEQWSF